VLKKVLSCSPIFINNCFKFFTPHMMGKLHLSICHALHITIHNSFVKNLTSMKIILISHSAYWPSKLIDNKSKIWNISRKFFHTLTSVFKP
jgi:hypothetical protein